ncbi:hypothetical protein SAMN05421747_1202 [Parapedobacter composti]|uniref:3-isopropylmalate dehydratase n=1 Tax=Parapedobacter composti TaxID=623281 RepID=A0A1I1L9T7_9SPHI|nr:3-isopropylmalate dehydratase [Parapedobacter composti]SFC69756.1 hypothetical protein SAMN05421747_1202 [Parapedobacter composti]
MHIIDLNGRKKEVTDLDKAIQQAENFKDMHHIPPVESDKERQAYWRDIYKKLVQLKSK